MSFVWNIVYVLSRVLWSVVSHEFHKSPCHFLYREIVEGWLSLKNQNIFIPLNY